MINRFLVVLLIIALVAMSSCQSMPTLPEEHKGAATGAGIGAATGAVLGAVMGKDVKSGVLGGLVGALAGGAIGHYYYDKKQTGTETAQKYNYDPSKGPMVKIDEVSITPQAVTAGGKVDLQMTYAVLTPSEDMQIALTEKRVIRHEGALVGNPEVRVTRSSGTYTSSTPLTLPANAKKGLYIVTYTIQSDNASDEFQSSFTVR